MSTRRKGKWGGYGKGPNGRLLCACGCGEELGADMKRRTSLPGHYEKWAAIHNPATVRRLVYARDGGVCADCGVDTEHLQIVMRQTRQLVYWLARKHADDLFWRGELPRAPGCDGPRAWGECYIWAQRWTNEEMRVRFGDAVDSEGGHTWEADHIIPVVEGGGECGLENYRTLCLPCHHKATAALAKRRAERRRQTKAVNVPELVLS